MSIPLIEGFLLAGGLIIAIGPQNALILRQGLLRQHVFVLCLVASLSDASLILLGVLGFGTLVQSNQTVLNVVTLGGAVFLAVYAILAAKRALGSEALTVKTDKSASLLPVLSTLLAFTFLNPHVYLDTVILLGGISGQYQGMDKWHFGFGSVLASFVWFFPLGYGARWLTPIFAKPLAWRILDIVIAFVMAAISILLFFRYLQS